MYVYICSAVGRAPPRGTRVEMTHIDISPNMDHWPSFHNGVAAGRVEIKLFVLRAQDWYIT